MHKSRIRYTPKSTVIKRGYINLYSELNPKELKTIKYKTKYKSEHPDWDETLVYLSDKFKKLGFRNAIVLDAGCGNGNYIIDENRKDIQWAAGVDVKDEFVANNICLDEIKISDLENIPYKPNTFDLCISLWVLEHVKSPEIIFEEIHRVLKPGGYFIFATPNKNFLPLKLMHILKSKSLNHYLNSFIFGRKQQDIFETYYKANDFKDIRSISINRFEIIELFYNFDPSYLSLNNLFYTITNFSHQIFRRIHSDWLDPHIIGILRKD